MIYKSATELIGNTPIIKLNSFSTHADMYIKLEKFNIGGSIKDRPALNMIEIAEKNGILKEGSIIVEPTSGNMGIALSLIGALKGYKVIIIMPDTMTVERRNAMTAYGAELVLTDGEKGMKGAIDKAKELALNNPNYVILDQFENINNSMSHYKTTGKEIMDDIPDIDAFIAGVGTSGTLSGIGKYLKEKRPEILVFAMEPENSSVLSGNTPMMHKIQGIGAGFVPDLYDKNIVDEIIRVTDEEAMNYTKLLAKNEGLLLGISSGANVAAAVKIANKYPKLKKIVTVAPDGGEKYLSLPLFKGEE
ncbi:MAG: cysteine synthase A [Bacillota bacterium]|nr:cysteine synthase A [Bacillota bacterium]